MVPVLTSTPTARPCSTITRTVSPCLRSRFFWRSIVCLMVN